MVGLARIELATSSLSGIWSTTHVGSVLRQILVKTGSEVVVAACKVDRDVQKWTLDHRDIWTIGGWVSGAGA